MSWIKGKQGYRLEYSSKELNKVLKELKGSIKEEEAKCRSLGDNSSD